MPTDKWRLENYKLALESMVDILIDYDGYDPNNAKSMKSLIDEMVKLADDTLHDKPVLS